MNTIKLALNITILILLLMSCRAPAEVLMPFRNYGVSSDRLMPLQQSDAKQCVRIWVSTSTSLDRVIAVEKENDSTFHGTETVFGYKWNKSRKATEQFKIQKLEPASGYAAFLSKLDELDIATYKSQAEKVLAIHEPYKFCLIEIKEIGTYHSFSFQLGSDTKADLYGALVELLQHEFPTVKFR